MSGVGKAIYAAGNLVFHFWAHTARRLVRRRKPGEGAAEFHANFRDDHFVSLTALEREELRNYEKCIVCGLCAAVCPVYMPIPEAGAYGAPDSITACLSRSFPEFGAARDAVYNCTQCGACALACPRGVNVPDLVMMVRRKTFAHSESAVRKMYENQIENFTRTGNIYGVAGQPFAAHAGTGARILFFAGCGARAFLREETEKALLLLQSLGADFTTIEETCCGSFQRSIGISDAGDFGRENARRIRDARAETVVTPCPHCYHTMLRSVHYEGIKIIHLPEFLESLLRPRIQTNARVTYHDPCFVGRRNGKYDAPRSLIKEMTPHFTEMPRARRDAVCCGAPEGECIADRRVADAMGRARVSEAAATGAEILLTECPACIHHLEQSANGKIKVRSLAAYMWDLINGDGKA